MARGIPVREIPRLRASGLPAPVMARMQPVSKTGVIGTFHTADERRVAREDVEGMSEAEACAPPSPEKVHEGPVYRDLDRGRVHREIARIGVVPRRLHEECRGDARPKGEPLMSCDRFRERHPEFTVGKQVVSRVGHRVCLPMVLQAADRRHNSN